MLWHVRIKLQQKLILLSIFSITVVVMIVSIIRVAVVHSDNQNADISWLYLWSNIEMATCMCSRSRLLQSRLLISSLSIAIIIACVASFRQLFITSQNQHRYDGSGISTTRRGLLGYFRSYNKSSNNSGSYTKWLTTRSRQAAPLDRSDSQTHIVPLHNIHVTQKVDISNTASNDNKINPQHFNFDRSEPEANEWGWNSRIV